MRLIPFHHGMLLRVLYVARKLCVLSLFVFLSTLETYAQKQSTQTKPSDIVLVEILNQYGEKVEITEKELQRAHELAPQTQSIENTLEQVIQLSLLQAEAERQGLGQHPKALDERDRVAVKHFISVGFEQKYRLDNLPQQYVEQSKQRNIGHFRHPELRQGVHILVKPTSEDRSLMNEQQAQALQAVVKRIKDDLNNDPVVLASELHKRMSRYQAWMDQGYEVIFENLGRFSATGPFIMSFNEACFKVHEAPKLIGPIQTPFGFHFTLIEAIIPPLDTPDAKIEEEVRKRILPEVRAYEWRKLITTLFQASEESNPTSDGN